MPAPPHVLCWMEQAFAELGDVFQARIDGSNAYVVRSPQLAEHVLRTNWQNYPKGRRIKRIALLLGNGLMTSEGETWKRQRRLIQPAFQRDHLARFGAHIAACNAALVDRWRAAASRDEDVELDRDINRLTLDITLGSIFGDDRAAVAGHFELLVEDPARTVDFAERFRACAGAIADIANRRRVARPGLTREGGGDLLDHLLWTQGADTGAAMSDQQLIDEIKTLVVAGHETTASTLQWLWVLLARHPEVADKLAAGPSGDAYASHILDEVMRLYPAGWLITRRALADDRLGEHVVPAGTEIYLPIYFIQRHPALWDRPDTFDPDRHASAPPPDRPRLAHLPFSAGPRNCVGEHLARLEMRVHLTMVNHHLRLHPTTPHPPELDVGINLRPKPGLRMRPSARRADHA